VILPLLWSTIVFLPSFSNLVILPPIFHKHLWFFPSICVFAPVLTFDYEQNRIDEWIVEGKVTKLKNESKITITLQKGLTQIPN
jgi:hypothetical protein